MSNVNKHRFTAGTTLSNKPDLEKFVCLIVEAVVAPRLNAIAQAIRELAANDPQFDDPAAVYRLPAVLNRVGISKSTWYSWTNPKSAYYDPTVPKGIKLGTSPRSPVAWRRRDIEAWIEARSIASRSQTMEDAA